MFRRSIPDDYALVFPFDAPDIQWLHMLFVPFAIDALWLVDGEVQKTKRLAPFVGLGRGRADTVVELPAGAADGSPSATRSDSSSDTDRWADSPVVQRPELHLDPCPAGRCGADIEGSTAGADDPVDVPETEPARVLQRRLLAGEYRPLGWGIPGPSSATTSEVHDSLGSSAAVISTRERSVSLWRIAFSTSSAIASAR